MRKVAGAFLLAVVLSMVFMSLPDSGGIAETDSNVLTTGAVDLDQSATQLADVALEMTDIQPSYSDGIVSSDRIERVYFLLQRAPEAALRNTVTGSYTKLTNTAEGPGWQLRRGILRT